MDNEDNIDGFQPQSGPYIKWRRYSPPDHIVPDPNNPGQMIAVPEGHQWSPDDINKMVYNAVNDAVAHLVAEIDGLTHRCEELEIELEIANNKFNDNGWEEIDPKRRGNF